MATRETTLSVCVATLTLLCFTLGAVAVGLPTWGYFFNPEQPLYDHGYFGPWNVCKELFYNREKCGPDVRFRPSYAVYLSGVVGAVGVSALGAAAVLGVVQLAALASREPVCMSYAQLLALRLALALLAGLLSVVSAALFAVQTDERDLRGFIVRRGTAFYIQILCIVLNAGLCVGATYDALWARRADPTGRTAPALRNPGFKDAAGRGVAVTRASGRPYAGSGSVASVDTAATTLSALSTDTSITRSPLRSSLKKPRADAGLGIHNPGYSGSSPPLGRNGSVKKVRIQTHSTEV